MNDHNLLALLEELIALYDSHQIAYPNESLTAEFLSFIGDVKDTLSNIE